MSATAHHRWDGGWWEMQQAAPHARLRGLVIGDYVEWREHTRVPLVRREVATAVVPLIVNFDAPYRLVSDTHDVVRGSFTAGLYDRCVDVHGAMQAYALQANLTPLFAHTVFRQPLDALTNASVALDDVLGADGRTLIERLGNAPSFAARVAMLDAFLLARLAAAPRVPTAVQHCWTKLTASHGTVRIAALQQDIGWSAARLADAMREHCGFTPRRVAGILRFERAITLARRAQHAQRTLSWSAIAAECAYADQAHLTREFRRYAGETPTEWMRGRVGQMASVECGDPE